MLPLHHTRLNRVWFRIVGDDRGESRFMDAMSGQTEFGFWSRIGWTQGLALGNTCKPRRERAVVGL